MYKCDMIWKGPSGQNYTRFEHGTMDIKGLDQYVNRFM
jgi:hypothetical protein